MMMMCLSLDIMILYCGPTTASGASTTTGYDNNIALSAVVGSFQNIPRFYGMVAEQRFSMPRQKNVSLLNLNDQGTPPSTKRELDTTACRSSAWQNIYYSHLRPRWFTKRPPRGTIQNYVRDTGRLLFVRRLAHRCHHQCRATSYAETNNIPTLPRIISQRPTRVVCLVGFFPRKEREFDIEQLPTASCCVVRGAKGSRPSGNSGRNTDRSMVVEMITTPGFIRTRRHPRRQWSGGGWVESHSIPSGGIS